MNKPGGDPPGLTTGETAGIIKMKFYRFPTMNVVY